MRGHEQLSMEQPYIEHSHAQELAKISQIRSLHPAIAEGVGQDLVSGLACPHTGARGMSGGQVLRVLLLKQMNGFSYRELEFHLADSVSSRTFCRFGTRRSGGRSNASRSNIASGTAGGGTSAETPALALRIGAWRAGRYPPGGRTTSGNQREARR